MLSNEKLEELENIIQYRFKDRRLLVQALTHSSYANEKKINKYEDYERLEFLGDAVLEVTSSDFLFHYYPRLPEGSLTKKRASMVCEPTLALCARKFGLDNYILLGKGEELTGGRQRDSIVSDVLEATIGAIYLDGGMEEAQKYIHTFILTDIEQKILFNDSKSALQELIQSQIRKPLSYKLVSIIGPEHCQEFTVQAMLEDQVIGEGVGRSKKAAEQKAAYEALVKYQGEGYQIS